ncbi:MAG TPA: hypothetical protein EYG89_05645 [Bacteroidia bacterium]|nr:hypothetical protein [Bacteroidia bacterium]
MSPIYIYLLFGITSIIISIIYFYFFDKINMYHFDEVGEKEFFNTIKLYMLALISYSLGIIVYYDLSLKINKKLFNQSFADSLFIRVSVNDKTVKVAQYLLLIIVIMYLFIYGEAIFFRLKYLPEVNRTATTILKVFSFIGSILMAFSYKSNKKKSVLFFIVLMFFTLGTGSRTMFLSLISYFVIIFVSSDNTVKNKLRFGFNMIFSLFFLAYVIELRSLNEHGIFPYLSHLKDLDGNFIDSFIFNIYYSLIFGVYVTIKTLQEATKDWNLILIGINPLPGKLAGWYDYAKNMRLNRFAPYSLHGRIFIMGKVFSFIYFFITGLIFSYFEKKIRQYINLKKRAIAFILVLLLILHIVYGFEYNFRSAFRYIYYALFVVLVTYSYSIVKPYFTTKPKKQL